MTLEELKILKDISEALKNINNTLNRIAYNTEKPSVSVDSTGPR